jgi:glycerate kinase
MRVLIAPNAFKGSLDAFQAADAIAEGFARGAPGADRILLPVADGGDGTVRVLVGAAGGRILASDVLDPLGRNIRAEWGMLGDGTTAVIEVARASGLALLSPAERDPLIATSFGAGQLVSEALARGCKRVVVGLGGSATVDGGAGFVEALGARLLDARGVSVARGGAGLASLDRIDIAALDPRLHGVELLALCDVDSELLGESGAAKRFGPQKGATPSMVDALEKNLTRFADIVLRDLGRDVRQTPCAGAAGGMGAAIAGILGGRLERGIDRILEWIRFDDRIAGCDLVVTAEGFLDRQTLGNKAPYGVACAARRHGAPVVVMVGGVAEDVATTDASCFDAVIPICPRPLALEEAMSKTRQHLAWSAEQLARLLARYGA